MAELKVMQDNARVMKAARKAEKARKPKPFKITKAERAELDKQNAPGGFHYQLAQQTAMIRRMAELSDNPAEREMARKALGML